MLSVTVQRKMAETVSPAGTGVAVNVVAADDALSALIRVDPDCRVQA